MIENPVFINLLTEAPVIIWWTALHFCDGSFVCSLKESKYEFKKKLKEKKEQNSVFKFDYFHKICFWNLFIGFAETFVPSTVYNVSNIYNCCYYSIRQLPG